MFIRLLLALIALVGVMAFLGWYGKASASQRNDAIKQVILYGVAIALLLLVVTGRIPWLFAIISATIPFWRKLMAARNMLGLFEKLSGKKFTTASFTTDWLALKFDIVSRAIDGEVRQGEFTGQMLSQLTENQIQSLLAACQTDRQSVAAIHAFMRVKNTAWSQESSQQNTSADNTMSRSQAFEILGLESNASNEEVGKAHKRLMQKLHPDRGGSSYLATQINLAKDTLLS